MSGSKPPEEILAELREQGLSDAEISASLSKMVAGEKPRPPGASSPQSALMGTPPAG